MVKLLMKKMMSKFYIVMNLFDDIKNNNIDKFNIDNIDKLN